MIRAVFPLLALISLSCGGSSDQNVSLPPLPAPETRATLVGPSCGVGDDCACRDPRDLREVAHAEAPHKRFEVRVGPAQHELWVTVDDMVLYKSRERATGCFYIDLLPGTHQVRVHGKREHGVAMTVQINELSAAGPWWYPTFEFDCGAGGLCDLDGIRREQKRIASVGRGIHAPCGSVKVEGFNWRTGTMPDSVHPGEIVVDFALKVYEFETTKRPGSDDCAKN